MTAILGNEILDRTRCSTFHRIPSYTDQHRSNKKGDVVPRKWGATFTLETDTILKRMRVNLNSSTCQGDCWKKIDWEYYSSYEVVGFLFCPFYPSGSFWGWIFKARRQIAGLGVTLTACLRGNQSHKPHRSTPDSTKKISGDLITHLTHNLQTTA